MKGRGGKKATKKSNSKKRSESPPQLQAPVVLCSGEHTSRDLTLLAEEVDGRRNEKLRIVETSEHKLAIEGQGVQGRFLFEVCTALNKEREPVTVTASAASTEETLQGCDAFFWSESAVEKFVWPYYYSHRTINPEIVAIKYAFDNDANVLGILHTYPSRPKEWKLAWLKTSRLGSEIKVLTYDRYLEEKQVLEAEGP
jgi:hypothetical protein